MKLANQILHFFHLVIHGEDLGPRIQTHRLQSFGAGLIIIRQEKV